MNSQEARNRKIIDAVIRKEQAELFWEEDYRRAEKELKEARCCYADAMTAEELNEVRRSTGGAVYFAENAVALLNKTYFRKGVSRRYEELHDITADAAKHG